MKRISHLLLAVAAVASLAACDRQASPGKDPQVTEDFSDAPPATVNETDRDSISGGQRVEAPAGKGSAADQQASQGDADAALESSPSNPNSPPNRMPKESEEAKSKGRE
jgi:hypothetical protein